MCGIVGYVGNRQSRPLVLDGLSRLEYRGYDSAGYASLDAERGFLCVKAAGGIENLVHQLEGSLFDGPVGMGHTRWATHGVSSEQNAHPHFDGERSVAVVHNGIIENYLEIKAELLSRGHCFLSETDTEVIAHLFSELLHENDTLEHAVGALVRRLHGAFACVLMVRQYPDVLIAIRRKSPLCIGVGNGEAFVASDVVAFAGHAKQVIFLPDETCALVRREQVRCFTFAGVDFNPQSQSVDPSWTDVSRDGFPHFMLKEIYEQKRVIHDTVEFCRNLKHEEWERVGLVQPERGVHSIHFVACGTSANAAEIAAFFFEKINGLPVTVTLASEFRHRVVRPTPGEIFCFLSQSGETADTLEALRLVKAAGGRTCAVVNVPGSSMVREADGYLLTQAQREVAVASTKSFTSQVALLYWVAHRLSQGGSGNDLVALYDLLALADVFESTMEKYRHEIETKIAPYYVTFQNFIFLGRAESYPLAREAALKLKEIAYRFVDCYPAGELKHGPIALIDETTPVFLFSSLEAQVYRKLLSGAQEVKARNGRLVVFAFEGQDELIAMAETAFVVPRVAPLLAPLALTGIMQLLVYHMAKCLGRSIDKPRNLAKSVTVE